MAHGLATSPLVPWLAWDQWHPFLWVLPGAFFLARLLWAFSLRFTSMLGIVLLFYVNCWISPGTSRKCLSKSPCPKTQQFCSWVYNQNNKKTGVQTKTCPWILTAHFTIAKRYKQPKCSSTDEGISNMWNIHTMEYYSALKRNEVSIHGWTLKTLCYVKDAIHKRPHIVWFHFYAIPRTGLT